jgi:hypothetical protein
MEKQQAIMINFFRKTRKKMADDNKPMKYVRYAIGEILLVVVGILIALSINNWNEENKNKKTEHTLYYEIFNDLEKDEIKLEGLRVFYKNRIEHAGWLLRKVKNPGVLLDNIEVGKHIDPLYIGPLYVGYTSSFDAAKSSGAFASFNFFREEYPVIVPPAIVGVQLKWNIFNGLTDYHNVKANKYAYDKIEYTRQNADKEIKIWITRSYTEAQNFNRQYLKALPTEKLAKKNLDIMHKRFVEGLGVSIDVLDAELLYASVKTERQLSLYLYYTALNQLYMAAGDPEKFIELLSK